MLSRFRLLAATTLLVASIAGQVRANPIAIDLCLVQLRHLRHQATVNPDQVFPGHEAGRLIDKLTALRALDPKSREYHELLESLLTEVFSRPELASDPVFRFMMTDLYRDAKKKNPEYWAGDRGVAMDALVKKHSPPPIPRPELTAQGIEGGKVPGDVVQRLDQMYPQWRSSMAVTGVLDAVARDPRLRAAVLEAERGKPELLHQIVDEAMRAETLKEGKAGHEKDFLESEAGRAVLRDVVDSYMRPRKPKDWESLEYALRIDPHSHWAGVLPVREYLRLMREAAGNPPDFYERAVTGAYAHYFNNPGKKRLAMGLSLLYPLRAAKQLRHWFDGAPERGNLKLRLDLAGREAALEKAKGGQKPEAADAAMQQIARFRKNLEFIDSDVGLDAFKADLARSFGKKTAEMGIDGAKTYREVLDILDAHFQKNRASGGNAANLLPQILNAEERLIGLQVMAALKEAGKDPTVLPWLTERLLTATNHFPYSETYNTRFPMESAAFGGGPDVKAKIDAFWAKLLRATIEHLKAEGVRELEVSMNSTQLKPDSLNELDRLGEGKVRIRGLYTIDRHELGGLASETRDAIRQTLGDKRVAGVDFAGPESPGSQPVTKEGVKGTLTDLAGLLGDAYKARKLADGEATGPLLLRVHVGEGFRNPWEPLNPTFARERLGMTLDAIKEMMPTLPDGVVIRLAHVTHATPEQVKLMGELAKSGKFFVDAPVMSNVVTKALETGTGKTYETHPLLQLLYHKVPTMLGSDSEGTMFFSLRENYRMVGLRVLDQFKEGKLLLDLPDGRRMTYRELIDAKLLTPEEAEARFSLKALEASARQYGDTMKLR